jgi:hypothetical protein
MGPVKWHASDKGRVITDGRFPLSAIPMSHPLPRSDADINGVLLFVVQ